MLDGTSRHSCLLRKCSWLQTWPTWLVLCIPADGSVHKAVLLGNYSLSTRLLQLLDEVYLMGGWERHHKVLGWRLIKIADVHQCCCNMLPHQSSWSDVCHLLWSVGQSDFSNWGMVSYLLWYNVMLPNIYSSIAWKIAHFLEVVCNGALLYFLVLGNGMCATIWEQSWHTQSNAQEVPPVCGLYI